MPDDGDGSITGYIAGMKAGDMAVAQPLWEHYFARMVDLARGGCGPRGGGVETPPAMRKMLPFQPLTACARAWPKVDSHILPTGTTFGGYWWSSPRGRSGPRPAAS